MSNRLPKSWAVKNDGSQLFKDTVIKYLNEKYEKYHFTGFYENGHYGVANNGICTVMNSPSYFSTILTLEEFINLTTHNTKTTEEQIKDIEKQLESLKASLVKPNFEVGTWYIATCRGVKGYLIRYNKANEVYGHDAFEFFTPERGNYLTGGVFTSIERPATPSEIQEALTKQWEKLGTINKVLKTNATGEDGEGAICLNKEYEYDPNTDELRCSVNHSFYKKRIIYSKGKFATIIADEVIKIGGYEVKFEGGHTTIDGHKFTKEFWEAAKIISTNSKACVKVGCSKQFDVSLDIINKILSKL